MISVALLFEGKIMRLVVHMGLHKSGSTHFQQLMLLHHDGLAARGIWYDTDGVCGAHHPVANAMLAGDAEPFLAMIRRARMAGCETVLLSSENFEALPFVPAIAAQIEQAADLVGVRTIEWHAVLREPGAYFESQYAQLSRHCYADPGHMFSEVMKKGVLFMPEPHRFPGAAPYWFFCFDYAGFLTGFAVGRELSVYDYADGAPFPGWQIAETLGVLPMLTTRPAAADCNHRLPASDISANFRARMREAVGDDRPWALVAPAVEAGIENGAACVAPYARAVGERYAASYREALIRFAPANPATRAIAA